MEFFCHTILGDGLVERGEIPFRLGNPAVSKRLGDPLPVDVVVHGERVPVLADGVQLVERGVGDVLVGKVVDDQLVREHLCHCVGIGRMFVCIGSDPVFLDNVPLGVVIEIVTIIGWF